MLEIELTDHKGDYWKLVWANGHSQSLYKGELVHKAWWYAPERPNELRHYDEVPLPIFTEWFE